MMRRYLTGKGMKYKIIHLGVSVCLGQYKSAVWYWGEG